MRGAAGTLLPEENMTTDRGDTIMATVQTSLPDGEDHGAEGTWSIEDQTGRRTVIAGVFLGMGSSFRPEHKGHAHGWAPKGTHCSTCRWTEIRLFRAADSTYYVVNCGASDVPGERDLIRVAPVDTHFEVVEHLTTLHRGAQRPTLTQPARRALAQAAVHDERLRDAYINSPVT